MKLSTIKAIGGGSITLDHSFDTVDPNIDDARAVILSLHDGARIPSMVSDVIQDTEALMDYVTVERDTGMALATKLLLKQIPGSVALYVQLPRGIVDANRNPECALQLRFRFAPDIETRLMERHEKTQATIRKLLSCGGIEIVLDMHSMCPKSPKGDSPKTTPDTLRQHVDYWVEGAKNGTPRQIDLIDAVEGEDKPLGNRGLSQKIQTQLEDAGFPAVFNQPYAKSRKNHPVDFIQDRGVSIDVLKPQVAGREGHEYSLLHSLPSEPKVRKLLDPIVRAVMQYFKSA